MPGVSIRLRAVGRLLLARPAKLLRLMRGTPTERTTIEICLGQIRKLPLIRLIRASGKHLKTAFTLSPIAAAKFRWLVVVILPVPTLTIPR